MCLIGIQYRDKIVIKFQICASRFSFYVGFGFLDSAVHIDFALMHCNGVGKICESVDFDISYIDT